MNAYCITNILVVGHIIQHAVYNIQLLKEFLELHVTNVYNACVGRYMI